MFFHILTKEISRLDWLECVKHGDAMESTIKQLLNNKLSSGRLRNLHEIAHTVNYLMSQW